MRGLFLFFLLFSAILLESTIVSIPITFAVLFCYAVVFTDLAIFAYAFFGGIILDALLLHVLGGRSIFFLVLLTVAFLYQRKFEIQRVRFVLVFSFLGSLLYGWIFGYDYVLIQSVISSLIAGGLFLIMQMFSKNV